MDATLFVNLTQRAARTAISGVQVPVLLARLQTQLVVTVYFFAEGSPAALLTGSPTFRFALKASATGTSLAFSSTATATATGYKFTIDSLDSAALRTAIGDQPELDCTAELEWTRSAVVERVSFPCAVGQAYIRSTDAAPDPNDDATDAWLASKLAAGSNITLTVHPTTGVITIASTGGAGSGDALVANNLDQFASVTQTAGQTLAITSSTTLAGGTHSGTNTGDQTNITGNAATVTTNANLTGPVTSTGNATAIANGAITNAMLANAAVANLSGTNTGDQSLAAYAPLASPVFTGQIGTDGDIVGQSAGAVRYSDGQVKFSGGANSAPFHGGVGGTLFTYGADADGQHGGNGGSLLMYGTPGQNAGSVSTIAGGSLTMGTANISGGNIAGTLLTTAGSAASLTDFPTLNQNTTGSAATLTTARTINGTSFNGSANITVTAAGSTLSDTVPATKGGTGLTAIGTALQVLRTNAGATALEFATLADATKLPLAGGTLTGALINSTNGAASAPVLSLTGTTFTGGTATTTKPTLVVEPTGTTSTGWSTNGTLIGANAATGFTGRLIDLQLAGSSKFSVSSAGAITASGDNVFTGTLLAYSNSVYCGGFGLAISSSSFLAFGSTTNAGGACDALLSRSAAASLQLGANHATTATNQTIKAHNVTTGTGADLTLSGGTGSAGNGAVRISGTCQLGQYMFFQDGVMYAASATSIGNSSLGFSSLNLAASGHATGITSLVSSTTASLQMGNSAASGWVSQTFAAGGGRVGTDTNNSPTNTLTIAGSRSTGTGTGGDLRLGVYGTNGTSGTAIGTLNTVLTVVAARKVLNIAGIPTSSAGLSSGDVYSNAGILTIVA